MCDLIHEINIEATSSQVFEAINTVDGLKKWWTADVEGPKNIEPGSKLLFGFYERQTVFRMLVEEIIPDSEVVWSCYGDYDEWIDTEIHFIIEELDGNTNLRFFHGNWESDEGMLGLTNTTWGMLLYRLRDYLEGKDPGPYF